MIFAVFSHAGPLAGTLVLGTVLLASCGGHDRYEPFGTPEDLTAIKSLWIGNLPPLPESPGNPVADDPRAVDLGHRLFFDTRMSDNGTVACANCHQPQRNFKDGLPRAQGLAQTARKSMTVVGTAYSPWLFWDGRRDSLWAQALQPLEDLAEHGANRVDLARLIAADPGYRGDYLKLFGSLPPLEDRERFPPATPRGSAEHRAAWEAMEPRDREAVSIVFANIGRAIEAYERKLQFGPAPFDAFAKAMLTGDRGRADEILTSSQRNGLQLFLGRANCIHCHNGPLFTNNEFHNTGLEGPGTLPSDRGRVEGVKQLQGDPFNCLGHYSGATKEDCAELRFVKTSGIELVGAFRTVSLRNIAGNGPFMHTGQFRTLTEVLKHYNEAQPTIISDELQPLHLTPEQIGDIIAFLESLSAPLAAPPELLRPPPGMQTAATRSTGL